MNHALDARVRQPGLGIRTQRRFLACPETQLVNSAPDTVTIGVTDHRILSTTTLSADDEFYVYAGILHPSGFGF
jgi:hypothetical protein